jgi:hypothetical protein
VAEAMGVAILMNGGPGTVWGPRAFAAFEEFAASAGERAASAGQRAAAAGEDKAARSGEVSPPGS